MCVAGGGRILATVFTASRTARTPLLTLSARNVNLTPFRFLGELSLILFFRIGGGSNSFVLLHLILMS